MQSSDLVYVGGFRLPFISPNGQAATFSAGGFQMGYYSAHNSLVMGADLGLNQYNGFLAEVSIPEIRNNVSAATDLAQATLLQPFTEVTRGHIWDVAQGGSSNGVLRGVLVRPNGDLFLSAYINYDGAGVGSRSHFKSGMNFANLPTVIGPVELNAGFGSGSAANGGYMGGWMTPIPLNWQGALGGKTALTSNWGIGVNSRASWGPDAFAFNPEDIGVVTNPVAIPLLYYNSAHPTLGRDNVDGSPYFNQSTYSGGLIFPTGTDTILAFEMHSEHQCYGNGTTDPTLDLQPWPGHPGEIYCYDVLVGGKGSHGNPWHTRVLAYDAHDLAAVRAGTKNPWDVTPYAYWDIHPPLSGLRPVSASYDPASQNIYVAMQYGDCATGHCDLYNAPLIHVYHVNVH